MSRCEALTQTWEGSRQRRCSNVAVFDTTPLGRRCAVHSPYRRSCPTCGRDNCRADGSQRCLFEACRKLAVTAGWHRVTHRVAREVHRLTLPHRRVPYYVEDTKLRCSSWVPGEVHEALMRRTAVRDVFRLREVPARFPDARLARLRKQLDAILAMRVLSR